jgi:hypothetical protein
MASLESEYGLNDVGTGKNWSSNITQRAQELAGRLYDAYRHLGFNE